MKYKNTDKNQDSRGLDFYCPDNAFFHCRAAQASMLLNQLKIKDAVPQGGLSKITSLAALKIGHPSLSSPACSLFHAQALSCTGSGAY